jgi:hypothetical protein
MAHHAMLEADEPRKDGQNNEKDVKEHLSIDLDL